jgi:hypothetical protein
LFFCFLGLEIGTLLGEGNSCDFSGAKYPSRLTPGKLVEMRGGMVTRSSRLCVSRLFDEDIFSAKMFSNLIGEAGNCLG